jgi:hypothetical protein
MSKHSVQINSIQCNATSEHDVTGGDELYLTCQADGGLPIRVPGDPNTSHSMEKGYTWKLDNLVLNFDYEVLLTLWDHDLNDDPNLATFLQNYDFVPGGVSGNKQLKNYNGADYTIYFTYLS